MEPIARLYVKAFLITGIPFGLLMMVYDVLAGEPFSIWRFLFLTVFFGVTMSIVLVSLHRYRLRKNGIKELTESNLKVIQKRKYVSSLSKQEFMNKLADDEILGAMNLTELENGIKLSSGMTWKSWGETITVIINPISQDEYEYEIISKPKVNAAMVDYGKNLENVNRVEEILQNVT